MNEKNYTGTLSAEPECRIKPSAASDYDTLMRYTDVLRCRYDFISVSSIGRTAENRIIPVLVLGKERDRGGDVYVGGLCGCDVVTPAALIRFITDYADFLLSGRRIYGINMQYLWENRTIHVIPMLNPDGYKIRREGVEKSIMSDRLKKINRDSTGSADDFSKWKFNALGRDLTVSFGELGIPEVDALKNYLTYYADTLDSVLELGGDCGITYSSGKIIPKRAKTVARLISRMSGFRLNDEGGGNGLCDFVISSLGKSAYHCGCLDEGEEMPRDAEDYIKVYAALREALFSCPLL